MAFCTALATHDIVYRCPKPISNKYKTDGNWQTYTREFCSTSKRKIAQATLLPLWCVLSRPIPPAPALMWLVLRQLGGPAVTHLEVRGSGLVIKHCCANAACHLHKILATLSNLEH